MRPNVAAGISVAKYMISSLPYFKRRDMPLTELL